MGIRPTPLPPGPSIGMRVRNFPARRRAWKGAGGFRQQDPTRPCGKRAFPVGFGEWSRVVARSGWRDAKHTHSRFRKRVVHGLKYCSYFWLRLKCAPCACVVGFSHPWRFSKLLHPRPMRQFVRLFPTCAFVRCLVC